MGSLASYTDLPGQSPSFSFCQSDPGVISSCQYITLTWAVALPVLEEL